MTTASDSEAMSERNDPVVLCDDAVLDGPRSLLLSRNSAVAWMIPLPTTLMPEELRRFAYAERPPRGGGHGRVGPGGPARAGPQQEHLPFVWNNTGKSQCCLTGRCWG